MHSTLHQTRVTQPSTRWNQSSGRLCVLKASSTRSPFELDEATKRKAQQAAEKAGQKLQELAQTAQDQAGRTFRRLDSEYNLTEKAQRAARRLEEQARDIDQEYGVRRRVRRTVDYVQRMWPTWNRQLTEFSETWYGKATILIAIVLLVSSPFFWSFLNFVLLIWWLALPLGAALINAAQKRAAEAAAAEEERRRQNPFADMFKSKSSTSSASSSKSGGYRSRDGPIIDADYTIIDDDKK